MCRLAIIELKNRFNEVKDDLSIILPMLERRAGGHGNSFIFYKKGQDPIIYREADFNKFKLQKALKLIEKHQDADYFMFHTRIRSTGKLTEKNLHPAVTENIVLLQNGTVTYSEGIKFLTGSDWDTQITAELVDKFSGNVKDVTKALTKIRSIWIGIYKGIPFVASGGGDLVDGKIGVNKDIMFIGSDLPYKYDYKELDKGSIWIDGEWVERKKKTYVTYGYGYGGRWADDCYGYGYNYGSACHTAQISNALNSAVSYIVNEQEGVCSVCHKQKKVIKNASTLKSSEITNFKLCKKCLLKIMRKGEIRGLDGKRITKGVRVDALVGKMKYIVITDPPRKWFKAYPGYMYRVCKKCGNVTPKAKNHKGYCEKCLTPPEHIKKITIDRDFEQYKDEFKDAIATWVNPAGGRVKVVIVERLEKICKQYFDAGNKSVYVFDKSAIIVSEEKAVVYSADSPFIESIIKGDKQDVNKGKYYDLDFYADNDTTTEDDALLYLLKHEIVDVKDGGYKINLAKVGKYSKGAYGSIRNGVLTLRHHFETDTIPPDNFIIEVVKDKGTVIDVILDTRDKRGDI